MTHEPSDGSNHIRGRLTSDMPLFLKCTCDFISQRWVFITLASIGLGLQSIFSVMMSITIIEMVVRSETLENHSDASCHNFDITSEKNQTFLISQTEHDVSSAERYPWDEYTQGIILSSFSWSCTIAQFFYGTLAERFGGKHLLGFGILAQAVLSFITPFVINWGGSTALIFIRILMGLASDGMFPLCNTMIPHWTTPEERTKIGNAVYAGSVLGLFFGNITPPLLMKYSGMGWPVVFYFCGILGMIWYPLWLSFVYENPDEHPFISHEEMRHLKKNIEEKIVTNKLPPAPWKHILKCKEFWAFTIGYVGCNCSYYVMLSGLPRYMGNVVNFPIESNGYFSALPFLVMLLNTILSTWICNEILNRRWMSLTNIRKLFTAISTAGPGIFLLLASYAECDKMMVIVMFIIGITLIGSIYPSLFMNPMDLSPNYAGSIMSLGSGISQSVAVLAPYLIGLLAPNSSLDEWRVVFWIVFLFACSSSGVYVLWFKADVQPWNDPKFGKNEAKCVEEKHEVELTLMS